MRLNAGRPLTTAPERKGGLAMANSTEPRLYPRCTWRTCRAPGPWTITAGTPGSGHYAQAGACDNHRSHVERRTKRYANGEQTVSKRLPNVVETAPQTMLELKG